MIQSYNDYKFYLEADRVALDKDYTKPKVFQDEIWRFERLLRKAEYGINCKNKINQLPTMVTRYRLRQLSLKLGFTIPFNVFGPGLSIAHYGTIVVNAKASVGANCRISQGVTIGSSTYSPKSPKLGNNIFIGPNAVIVGDITLADGIAIAANSYVDKSFLEPNITIGGCPAKKIGYRGSKVCWKRATEIISNGNAIKKQS